MRRSESSSQPSSAANGNIADEDEGGLYAAFVAVDARRERAVREKALQERRLLGSRMCAPLYGHHRRNNDATAKGRSSRQQEKPALFVTERGGTDNSCFGYNDKTADIVVDTAGMSSLSEIATEVESGSSAHYLHVAHTARSSTSAELNETQHFIGALSRSDYGFESKPTHLSLGTPSFSTYRSPEDAYRNFSTSEAKRNRNHQRGQKHTSHHNRQRASRQIERDPAPTVDYAAYCDSKGFEKLDDYVCDREDAALRRQLRSLAAATDSPRGGQDTSENAITMNDATRTIVFAAPTSNQSSHSMLPDPWGSSRSAQLEFVLPSRNGGPHRRR